jgi:hypothetical protein
VDEKQSDGKLEPPYCLSRKAQLATSARLRPLACPGGGHLTLQVT